MRPNFFCYRFRLPAGVVRILAGNFLEHYDHALFGLLTPFLAPLLFPKEAPIVAMIWGYALLPITMLAKPLGALFFGRWSDRNGLLSTLRFTLVWMGASSLLIAACPSYQQVGAWAPILIVLARWTQSFCSSSEVVGGGLYLLARVPEHQRNFFSGLFGATTIFGIGLASLAVSSLATQNAIAEGWRFLFLAGASVAAIGWWLRGSHLEVSSTPRLPPTPLRTLFATQMLPFARMVLISGLGYSCYSIAFLLPPGLIPFVTPLSKAAIAQQSPLLFILDGALLLVGAWLANRWEPRRIMMVVSGLIALLSVPIFGAFAGASLSLIFALRALLVVLGVLFCIPIRVWSMQLGDPASRATLLFVGYALGCQLLGAPTGALCLWLFHKTGWAGAAGLYPALLALCTCYTLYAEKEPSPQASY